MREELGLPYGDNGSRVATGNKGKSLIKNRAIKTNSKSAPNNVTHWFQNMMEIITGLDIGATMHITQ